jgi:hypothetical protein
MEHFDARLGLIIHRQEQDKKKKSCKKWDKGVAMF